MEDLAHKVKSALDLEGSQSIYATKKEGLRTKVVVGSPKGPEGKAKPLQNMAVKTTGAPTISDKRIPSLIHTGS